MKNKKLVAIIITAALTLTACQSSKANIGTSTEVPGDSTSAEETTVSTSSVETRKTMLSILMSALSTYITTQPMN